MRTRAASLALQGRVVDGEETQFAVPAFGVNIADDENVERGDAVRPDGRFRHQVRFAVVGYADVLQAHFDSVAEPVHTELVHALPGQL